MSAMTEVSSFTFFVQHADGTLSVEDIVELDMPVEAGVQLLRRSRFFIDYGGHPCIMRRGYLLESGPFYPWPLASATLSTFPR
jgi:hypothetical protein